MSKEEDPFRIFNRYCKHIFKEMVEIYPDSKILKMVKASFSLLKKVCKKAAANFFFNNVLVHHKHHVDQRIPFFLNPQFSVTGFENIGTNINETWNISSEKMREKYWEYMIKLTELCMATRKVVE